MVDREKTISGLKEIADYFHECRSNVSFGSKAEEHFWELQSAARDALELLKEQEPKSVLSERECETLPNHYERKGLCPKCHQVVEWYLNRAYCGFCGQAVKWDA